MPFPMMPLQAYFAIWWHSCLSAEIAMEQALHGKIQWASHLQNQAKTIEERLKQADKSRLSQTLRGHMAQEWQTLCDGALVGCRATQQEKPQLDAEAIWQQGSVTLRDYAPHSNLQPILVVPSLINRAYILDLHEDCSFLRHLVSQGFRPLLVEWSDPVAVEKAFKPEDYVNRYLVEILSLVRQETGKLPFVLGYCAGGVLATALVQLKPADVAGLILLATPWDFHVDEQVHIDLKSQDSVLLKELLKQYSMIPAEIVQAMFYWLYPDLVRQKLKRLARFGKEVSASVFAMEHWVNDGIGLTSACAETFWLEWMQQNALAKGEWRVDGTAIDPQAFPKQMPLLAVMPSQDKIVPPTSTQTLIAQLSAAGIKSLKTLLPDTGHVGMIVGKKARKQVWQPCVEWMTSLLHQ